MEVEEEKPESWREILRLESRVAAKIQNDKTHHTNCYHRQKGEAQCNNCSQLAVFLCTT